jgi:hypothetical protein
MKTGGIWSDLFSPKPNPKPQMGMGHLDSALKRQAVRQNRNRIMTIQVHLKGSIHNPKPCPNEEETFSVK